MMTEPHRPTSEPLPTGLSRFISMLAITAGCVALAAGWSLDGGWSLGLAIVAGVFAVAFVQARWTLLRFRRWRGEVLYHDDVLFPFLLVFLGPAGAVISICLGTVVSNLIDRRAVVKTVYNLSQFTFAAGLGAGVFWLLDEMLIDELRGFAVLVGSSIFTVVGVGMFARLTHHLSGQPWWSLVKIELADNAQRYGAEVLLGVTAAVAVEAVPFMAPIALLAILVVLQTHQKWFRIARDRERLEDMLSATISLQGMATVQHVQDALVDAIRMLTGGETEFIPGNNQAGKGLVFEVDTGGEQPQMASVTRLDPLDATEVVIVETLVRVAEVSMRIAALVELHAEQSEELVGLIEERERFLTGTAHQLRTPLTVILGFGHIIANQPDAPDEIAESAGHIVREAAEMSNALDNLLIASRAVLDSLLVSPARVDLDREVERIASEFRPTGAVPVFGGSQAVGDPVRVRQVVRNLIRNARQHGGPDVLVTVGEEDGRAYVDVIDNGPGVPEDQVDTVFLPFIHAQGVAGQPGTPGLGLHAARHLARLMRGDVTYRREDERTVFRLDLPLSRVSKSSTTS